MQENEIQRNSIMIYESVQENEMHKILWDIKKQTDPQIPSRRPFVVMNKKNWESNE